MLTGCGVRSGEIDHFSRNLSILAIVGKLENN
jgi:hypothetical protein